MWFRRRRCPKCRGRWKGIVRGPYHSGFSNIGVAYCDQCSGTLVFESYSPEYGKIVKDTHPWCLSNDERREVERHFTSCKCGGSFHFDIAPCCPNCRLELPIPTDPILKYFVEPVLQEVNGDRVWQT